MGWKAFFKDGTIMSEGVDGRPVQAGEEHLLWFITQEDYGHKVLVDLINGVIVLDYEGEITTQNSTVEIHNPKSILYVCDETNIVGELVEVTRARGRATKEGVVKQNITPIKWRPIWFSRVTMGAGTTKVIGLQTTTGKTYGNKNIKKIISLFPDGRVGIN